MSRIGIRMGIGLGLSSGGSGLSAELTQVVDTFLASGTWTSPSNFKHPDGTDNAVLAQCWAAGGGGTTGVGAGGGGGFSEGKITGLAISTGYSVAVGTGAVNANGGNSTFNTSSVVAEGGKSGTNGGTGGAAANGTGDTKFSGGNGGVGTGSRVGGGGAGNAANGSGATGGAATGGFGASSAAGAIIGAGGASTDAVQLAGARGEGRIIYDTLALAGYPRIRGRIFGRSTADGTSHNVTLSGTVAGELLVMLVGSDGIPTASVSGWTALTPQNESTNQCSMSLFYKTATGTDNATIALTASEQVGWEVLRVAGGGTPTWTTTQGSSTNADPPSHATGVSLKYLWLAVGVWDGNGGAGITGMPASFGSLITVPPLGATGVQLAVCDRFSETATMNPGAFTSATEQWCAGTVSIPPV